MLADCHEESEAGEHQGAGEYCKEEIRLPWKRRHDDYCLRNHHQIIIVLYARAARTKCCFFIVLDLED